MEYDNTNYPASKLISEWSNLVRQKSIITNDPYLVEKYQMKADKYYSKFLDCLYTGKTSRIIWCFQLHDKYCRLINKEPKIWLDFGDEKDQEANIVTFSYSYSPVKAVDYIDNLNLENPNV